MDNSINKSCLQKIKEILLVVVSIAGLVYMIIHWR